MRESVLGLAALHIPRGLPWGRWALVASAVLVPMVLAGFVGMVIGLGSPQLTLIVVGAVGGLALLLVPTPAMLQILFWLSFVGIGLALYYGRVNQSHWLPYALCACLWLKLPIDALSKIPTLAEARAANRRGPSAIMVCIVLLFITMALSAGVNQTSMLGTLVATRNYFLVWAVTIAVAAGTLPPAALRRVVLLFVFLAALQAPFSLQQHFVNFTRSASFDSVVGTFGGDPDGSGASGGMVIFLAIGHGLALALWRRGQISGRTCALVVVSVLVTTMMAEVKAFFVFAPLVTGIVLLRELRARPGFAMAMFSAMAVALAGMLVFYKVTYFDSSRTYERQASVSDYLDYAVKSDSDVGLIVYKTGEVSRIAAPLIWIREGGYNGLSGRLLGNGPRASMLSHALGLGDAAKRFPFNLNTSTVTVLLWDLGLAGLAIFVALLCVCAWRAWTLSRHAAIDDFHRAALEGMAAAFVLALASLLYNDAILNLPPLQVFYAFAAGYVVYWSRQVSR